MGGVHGIAQIIENHIKIKKDSKVACFFSWVSVFVFCSVAWVFFRAGTIKDAFYVIETLVKDLAHPTLFLHNTIGLGKFDLCQIVLSLLILAIVDYISKKKDVIYIKDHNKTIYKKIEILKIKQNRQT